MRDTEPEVGITELCHIECCLCHIIGQELTIRARICDELTLIERLRKVECLLRRIAESLVCFSLERGQVIQLRSFVGLYLTLDRADRDRLAVTGRNERFSDIFIVNSCRRKNELTAVEVCRVILLLDKPIDLRITLNDHRKCRSLHSADVELTAIANGKQS